MERIIFLSIFVIAISGMSCTKQQCSQPGQPEVLIERFLRSAEYNRYVQQFPSNIKGLEIKAARVNTVEGLNPTIHVPVIRNNRVQAVIIGIPGVKKGEYQLIYQDNTPAINGTGVITQFSALHEKLATISVVNGKLQDFRIEKPVVMSREEEDCGLLCRLNRCYYATKSQFPGDVNCSILDLFLGVCSSATITTCLIKMAAGQA